MELTIPAALDSAASLFGDQPAIVDPGGVRLTFRQLRERVHAVAAALVADGIEPGDRVAVWSPNTWHWVLAALGAQAAGAALVPVNTRFTGPEALDVIGRSGARALFVAGRFLGTDRLRALREAELAEPGRLGSLRLVIRIPVESQPEAAGPAEPAAVDWADFEQRGAAAPAGAAARRSAAVAADDVSDILFTSGTTGRSKGAMSAHRQALAVAAAWAECAGITRADRYLAPNPFFHGFGYKAGILACLLTGATLVPQLVYDPQEAMRLSKRSRSPCCPQRRRSTRPSSITRPGLAMTSPASGLPSPGGRSCRPRSSNGCVLS